MSEATPSLGGRPSTYDPAYCERVIALGCEGKSKAQIAAALDTSRPTLDKWAADNPDFLDAITLARDLSLAWWEDQGQKGIWAKEFNASAYRLQVMNRFPADWRDRQDHAVTGITPIVIQISQDDAML